MKKLFSILLVALMLVAPAFAETHDFSPYDHTHGSAGGSRYLYYEFPDILIYLPGDWEGKITVEQTENGVAFYQTASLEKYLEEGVPGGGFLFMLCASENEDFRELPEYADLGYSENAGLHFYLSLPSDYPAYLEDDIRAEYDAMSAEIEPVVVEMAKIRQSMEFYTDGIESTDMGMS